jgi:hypothetical protein
LCLASLKIDRAKIDRAMNIEPVTTACRGDRDSLAFGSPTANDMNLMSGMNSIDKNHSFVRGKAIESLFIILNERLLFHRIQLQ